LTNPLTDPHVRAPEFPIGLHWLNTPDPITLGALRGKVVLLDFWTFCCINCMHVLPDLAYLETKYPDTLTVIGVHSAKFTNEGLTEQIEKAIARYGIRHPVVNDRDFLVWNQYGAHAWPTFALIDPEGNLVGMASGEGKREILDQAVDTLVRHHRAKGTLRVVPTPEPVHKESPSVLRFPGKLDATPGGRLIVSDSGHHRLLLLEWDPKPPAKAARLVEIVGSGNPGLEDGSFSTARFRDPQGLRFDPDDPVLAYVADTGNHAIRLVDFRSRTVRTVSGTGNQGWAFFDRKNALSADLSSPWDLIFLEGTLYIAMAGPHQIVGMDLGESILFPVAGTGREDILDGSGDRASLAQPSGLASDGSSLYFADSETSSIRRLVPGGTSASSRVETLVGHGLFEFGNRDGTFDEARLQHPLGVLWDDGILLVADTYNHRIRALDPSARTVVSLNEGRELDEPGDIKKCGSSYLIANTNAHTLTVLESGPGGPRLFPLPIAG
jgi:thiol-disulfide isomerase/thioredoxin